jgi:hypothetical protein
MIIVIQVRIFLEAVGQDRYLEVSLVGRAKRIEFKFDLSEIHIINNKN